MLVKSHLQDENMHLGGYCMKKITTPIINSVSLGKELHEMRTRAGFKNADEFRDAIVEIGVSVSSDTIKRIERGDRLPNLELFFAMHIVCEIDKTRSSWAYAARCSLEENLSGLALLMGIRNETENLINSIERIKKGYLSLEEDGMEIDWAAQMEREAEDYRTKASILRYDLENYPAQGEEIQLKDALLEFVTDLELSAFELEQFGKSKQSAKPAQ